MYSEQQKHKNESLVEIEMKGCTPEDRKSVLNECSQHWATDAEALQIIERKKEEISLRATDAEIDEVFKYARV